MGRGRARQTAAPGARRSPPLARAALTPLRAFPAGARHVFKRLLLDRQLRRAPTTRVGAGSRVGSGRLLSRRPVSASFFSSWSSTRYPVWKRVEDQLLKKLADTGRRD